MRLLLPILFIAFICISEISAQATPVFVQPSQTSFSQTIGDGNFTLFLRYSGDMGTMPDIKLAAITGPGGTVLNGTEQINGSSNPCSSSGTDFLIQDFDNFCDETNDPSSGPGEPDEDDGELSFNPDNFGPGVYMIDLLGNGESLTITLTVLPASTASPTMSEWGVFLFALLMLTLGVVTLFNAQLTMAGSRAVSTNFQLPFDRAAFMEAMKHACGLGLVGFAIILIGWGEITGLDLFGMGLTVPLLAYLIHVVRQFKQEK